ncbi:MAG: squalene/phytoene synthase family protein [Alphaproteobacteria bacterium]|nr:squalene/phytoene synthase family protein [Alphaproteobacteria bacterium]MBV9861832.1 squalene/phytoene synthase family protein [Alphaproteobacteria bacterium]
MKGETNRDPTAALATHRVASLAALLRDRDPGRYRTALFAPPPRREGLFALYAFNDEIARVRERVSEPMLGQIRLQWWREVIDAAYRGARPRAHAVVAPLTAAIREFAPSRAYFETLIDARERDLDDAAPATLAALEDYAEASSSPLVCLALEVLGQRGPEEMEAAREVGIAYGLTGLMRALPRHARTGRRMIPADVAARAGLAEADWAGAGTRRALGGAIAEIAEIARAHLDAARQRCGIPRRAVPALLPAVIAGRVLARLQKAGYDPFAPALASPDPLLTWRLAAAFARGRF